MFTYIREPINGLTHLVGALLSFVALLAMVIKVSIMDPSILNIFSVIVFGMSMILLYTASATYHMVIARDRVAGLAMLPGALITGLLAPIIGRIFDKVGAKWLVLPGLIIITSATVPFILIDTQTTFAYITVLYSIRMLGLVSLLIVCLTVGLRMD